MNFDTSEARITQLINEVVDPMRDWIEAVQVIHLPYQRSSEKFFLLVNLNVKTEVNDKTSLLTKSLEVAQTIIRSTLLSIEKGIEISFWIDVPAQRTPKRVFRLSVLEADYSTVLQTKSADLGEMVRAGILCQWPLQSPQ